MGPWARFGQEQLDLPVLSEHQLVLAHELQYVRVPETIEYAGK
jgi:hypothetical protein